MVAVTGNAAGSYTDTTGAPSSTAGGTGVPASNFAPLVVVAPPGISAGFSPSTVTVGTGGSSNSTLSFTLTNPNLSTALTGVAFELADRVKAGADVEEMTRFATALFLGGIESLSPS